MPPSAGSVTLGVCPASADQPVFVIVNGPPGDGESLVKVVGNA